jgi:hypothetical protein
MAVIALVIALEHRPPGIAPAFVGSVAVDILAYHGISPWGLHCLFELAADGRRMQQRIAAAEKIVGSGPSGATR